MCNQMIGCLKKLLDPSACFVVGWSLLAAISGAMVSSEFSLSGAIWQWTVGITIVLLAIRSWLATGRYLPQANVVFMTIVVIAGGGGAGICGWVETQIHVYVWVAIVATIFSLGLAQTDEIEFEPSLSFLAIWALIIAFANFAIGLILAMDLLPVDVGAQIVEGALLGIWIAFICMTFFAASEKES